ncbi:hypothetical protein FQN60_011889 [Etheostoma spectabile]|uniref:DNA-directed primase/polymerase protein n=1 Tax=Etheostoma spectabile TaxID=54343 RepID=A0A5J5DMT0_9PERO|nr:hypothetical protein FQN60_011889 [Etheostoma spectabile]
MRKWGDRLNKVEQLAQSFQLNPLAAHYKPRLWPCQPSSVWKLFPRQRMAISFAQSCKEDVHVFALEKEKTSLGQRIFLVTSYSELWHYYRTYTQSLMHCYEVIPEGAVCKLYFDLEFHAPSNKGTDGKAMVSLLIQYVCDKLMEVYGIECSTKNVLNLDSSTEEKFSRHLIFNLQNAAFKDNIHMGIGKTAEETTAKADEMAESPQAKRCKQEERDLRFLRVKTKDGQVGLFVDLGVYTKNRNFRLYKSSKVGQNAAFTLADDNKFIDKPEKGMSAEQSQRILTSESPKTKESKTLKPDCQQGSVTNPDLLSGCLSSPHKEVDNFVLTVVKKDGVHGSKIVVDLKKEEWYQKCHDPECRNFRSPSYPLPQEICVSYIMTLDEEDQAYLMDDVGNIVPSQAPNQAPQSAMHPKEESADVWGDGEDDQDYLESLDDFEQNSGEISDQLLLKCMADFDSQ